MRAKTLYSLSILMIIVISCQVTPSNKTLDKKTNDTAGVSQTIDTSRIIRDASYYRSKGFQVFEDFGFAIKCPIQLADISNNMSSHYDFCYGGIENSDSPENYSMYQVLINNFPSGYRNASMEEREKVEEKFLYNTFPGEKEKVVFENIKAVVVKYQSKNKTGRSLIFIKDNRSYVFNLISNDNITSRFNKLSNNIVLLGKKEK